MFRTERPKPGWNSRYLLERLRRDHPELAARVAAGELRPRAAAREAGIVKDPTPLEELKRNWKKASPAERRTFQSIVRDWVGEPWSPAAFSEAPGGPRS